jgi:hypothetical protein
MTQMNQEAEDAKVVMARIDEYLGTTPACSEKAKEPAKAERTQAAKKNGSVLHVMYDVTRKEILGVSIGGKVIAGAVAINMRREGISVFDSEGKDLLGNTKAAAGDSHATRVQQDIIDWLNGGGE